MNPSNEVLSVASMTITNMMNASLQNKPILSEHTPWRPAPEPSPFAGVDPWPRILPRLGENYYEAQFSEMPSTSILNPSKALNDDLGNMLLSAVHSTTSRSTASRACDPTSISLPNDPMLLDAESPPMQQQTLAPNLFDSILDDPRTLLANHPELYPGGAPDNDILFQCPELQQWPENVQTSPPDSVTVFSPSMFLSLPSSASNSSMVDDPQYINQLGQSRRSPPRGRPAKAGAQKKQKAKATGKSTGKPKGITKTPAKPKRRTKRITK
jgi:hypothetical protein